MIAPHHPPSLPRRVAAGKGGGIWGALVTQSSPRGGKPRGGESTEDRSVGSRGSLRRRLACCCLALAGLAAVAAGPQAAMEGKVLFTDNFGTDAWQTWHSNMETGDAMRPDFAVDKSVRYERGGRSLVIAGNTNTQAKGSWRKDLTAAGLEFEPGEHYRFTAWYAVKDVPDINSRVFACVTWGTVWGTEKLVPAAVERQGRAQWIRAERIVQITKPKKNKPRKVELQLCAGWLPPGSAAHYGKVTVEHLPGYVRLSRKIRVVTIDGAPPKKSTLARNRDYYVGRLREACEAHSNTVDVVCLPEYFNGKNVRREKLADIGVTLDGPEYMQPFKDVARACKVNIVGSVVVDENGVLYNTGFLIDRQGRLAGTQRKTHIPMQEFWWGGGRDDELRVIDADFGKIGILICWDYYLTDPIRTLAAKGAEIIFVPIEGDSRAADGQKRKAAEYIGVASALQNQIPMVFCFLQHNIARGNQSLIIDQDGRVKARSDPEHPVNSAEVTLHKKDVDRFVNFFMDRRPELHDALSDDGALALWNGCTVEHVPNPGIGEDWPGMTSR